MLGISPALGRNFLPEEDVPHGPPVVMISYALWQGHYGGDRQIIGREINIDGNFARVVGVLPRDFQFPTLELADVVKPMQLDAAEQNTVNGGFGDGMRTFARLKPGMSLAEAQAEMQLVSDPEMAWMPEQVRNLARLSIRPLREREMGDARRMAWILLSAVAAVLLIACANVAGLMIARGAARQRELAVRAALGASRWRLARQGLTEALLLAMAGAAVGMALAEGLLRIFVALAPAGVPFLGKAHLDLRIAAFTVVLALACGVVFGLTTALHRPDGLMVNARSTLSRRHVRLRRGLVMSQIAASVVLLAGAALLLLSFQRIEEQRLGFTTHDVMTAQIALPGFRYNTDAKWMEFHLQVEQAMRGVPGVTVAGLLQAAVHNLDPTVPVEMEPLTETVNRLADRPRFETALLGFFALMGLAMAAVGIFGILAYLTSQRTQEIGVRMALGATRANILGPIARDGLRMVLAGEVLGLAAALGLAHVLRALLYQTSTYDTLAFVAGPAVLCVVAGAAVLLPARAGMKVEPTVALRYE